MQTDYVIPEYPDSIEVTIRMRPLLHPVFKRLSSEISEFTFANIYLFRDTHSYRLSFIDGRLLISGCDGEESFFMLPSGLPGRRLLDRLFSGFSFMKNATEKEAGRLVEMGYNVEEDRDNFDYVYLREDLDKLSGRKFHKKKNLVNAFLDKYTCEGVPLVSSRVKDARYVLEEWRKTSPVPGDYVAAVEALSGMETLGLCGAIYYVEGRPAAYAIGEELRPDTFVVHFEKGIEGTKGLLQFVNRSFASILPDKYVYINREQDLGDEGLRHSKESYKPCRLVKKFKAR